MRPYDQTSKVTHINNPSQFSSSDPRSALPLIGVMQTIEMKDRDHARTIFQEISEHAKGKNQIIAVLNEFIGDKWTVKVKLPMDDLEAVSFVEKAMGGYVAVGNDRAQGW